MPKILEVVLYNDKTEKFDLAKYVMMLNGKIQDGCVVRWAYAIHDKDVRADGTLKDIHTHIELQFAYDVRISDVASWFGVSDNFVSKAKKGSRYKNLVKYLIHLNAPDKYQYDISSIVASFDVEKFMSTVDSADRKDAIINDIVNGVIREYNQCDKITPLEFVQHRRAIDGAFEYRRLSMINKGDRNMDVVFITGGSGTGKTTYAKMIASNKGYAYYVSSSSNDVLDTYMGQECIILDDLRASDHKLSDLLKLLDNNTNTTAKSRYHNKVLTNCELIIITTIFDIDTFYRNVFENESEPIKQLKRRCKTYIDMRIKDMTISYYDTLDEMYSHHVTIDNPVYERFCPKKSTNEEFASYLSDVLGINIDETSIDDFEPL